MRQSFLTSTLLALTGLSTLACSGAGEPEPSEEVGAGGVATGGTTGGTTASGGQTSGSGGTESGLGGASTGSGGGGDVTADGGSPGVTPTCDDGIENQDETDVDCGGVCDACLMPETCGDGVQNQDETGVDCGGVCTACGVAPTCSDGVQNQNETDVDCGGVCDTCPVPETCSDGVRNQNETGVDCGGVCDTCPVPETCDDGIENQDETDVDCGGVCDACPVPETCDDGVQNQDETDVDCGGVCGACSTPVYYLPDANAQFDYQIGGAYTPPSGVQVVSRDREASPAAGMYNICYVNGFQIQPGEESWWQNNYPELILRDGNGDPIVDDGWDEMLVDVSTPEKRAAAAAIVGAWIEQCANDGYDAVEIDNLDSYGRSDGELSQSDNVAFMGLLADIAHAHGLAAAQKNSTEFLDNIDEMHTDFAIAEECNEWDECGDYQSAYGNLVFVIEYDSDAFDEGCSNFPELSIVLRDMSVSPNGTYDAC